MAKIVRLRGGRVALSASQAERIDVAVKAGRILPFDSRVNDPTDVDLSGHLLLPGLINAHDHLEFNLFPRLGRGPWPNASAWAAEVHRPDESPVKEHLRVSKNVRLIWGGIKNLLSGATTVAHHNPYEPFVFTDRFPVRVVKRYGWAHSLPFSPDIRDRWKRTPVRWPFIVHAAEGTDECAHREIPRLQEMGLLDRRAILVHAVGATQRELETIHRSGSSIVWCPSANLFTLGRTLPGTTITSGVPIALGTDSALTGCGDLIDEMQCAKTAAALTEEQIYPLVTSSAARMLRLNTGQGMIRERGVADLVAVADQGQTPAEALLDLQPELVMARGRVMLMSDRFAQSGRITRSNALRSIHVEDRGWFLIRADVPSLFDAAAKVLGSEVRLAGKRIWL
jgi:cytosine/adenosine deaminase-related metal-dependent hydrolase